MTQIEESFIGVETEIRVGAVILTSENVVFEVLATATRKEAYEWGRTRHGSKFRPPPDSIAPKFFYKVIRCAQQKG